MLLANEQSALFLQAKSGCLASLGKLLACFCEDRRSVIARRIPDDLASLVDASDVLQQTCVDAFAQFERCDFTSVDKLMGWLDTIARRNAIDVVRSLRADKRGGNGRTCLVDGGRSSESTLLHRLPVYSVTASRNAMQSESIEHMHATIAELPPHYQEVIRRCELKGEPVDVVAHSLGRSVGATLMIRSRAITLLGRLMDSNSKAWTALSHR